MKTKTVFRIYKDGEVIALFPQVSAEQWGVYCQSFMHVGQHGGADITTVVTQTRLAKLKEYKALAMELRQRGYKLQIAKRCTHKDFNIRQQEAKRV